VLRAMVIHLARSFNAFASSYPQFHRVFRARMGRSPAEHVRWFHA